MRIPILTYHSMKIHGTDYASNDLVALASDLETVRALGMRIISLADLVRRWRLAPAGLETENWVALSCDDGGDFDFHDLDHPSAGPQRSVTNVLRGFHSRSRGLKPHITSFVIASPEARVELDKTCMVGRGWWTDSWWPEAVATGVMDIANHSWDHNHEALPDRFSHGVPRGTFKTIATRALADLEIRKANDFLRARVPNAGNALFAYPYGDVNDYLADEYFPSYGREIGLEAAFTDAPDYLTAATDPWRIPRFVFGRDWTSPAGLEKILNPKFNKG